ncbi:hypothetical protein ACNKHW_23190 [Shigella flexneri]
MVHGRDQTGRKKQAVMAQLRPESWICWSPPRLLKSVDVPDASLMIIENPERLGLAYCISCAAGSDAARRSPLCCLVQTPRPKQQTALQVLAGTATTALLSRRKTSKSAAG